MIYTPENSKGKRLVDAKGTPIDWAKSFDDETNEVELIVNSKDDFGHPRSICRSVPSEVEGGKAWEIVTVKVLIPGAKMVDKKYEEIK